ncbi:MAG: hypothetical protein AB7S92_05950 [Parvibaculaceae bacterium]|jgi:hypothetical protein
MARGKVRPDRSAKEISDAILAEWYRVLPEGPDANGDIPAPLEMDKHALTAAFNLILDDSSRCQVILDEKDKPIKVVVPFPPAKTRAELLKYIQENADFQQGMGVAILFGCGR